MYHDLYLISADGVTGSTDWLDTNYQWIGLRANLQESLIFHGRIYGFL